MKVRLETERLILRPFTIDDAFDMFNGWACDDEVTKYLTWNTHDSIETTKQIINMWIEQYKKPERINFAFELKSEDKLIGGIDVVGYIDKIPVIGYVLSREYWGFGYMTEACKKVIEFLFSLGYDTVRIDAFFDNIASNKVIKKCGGLYIDTYEEFLPQKNKKVKINRYLINK